MIRSRTQPNANRPGPKAVSRRSASSNCLDRWPGRRARAGGCRGGRRQGRALRPSSGLQPYRPPSRDRPHERWDGRTAKKDALRRCITTMGHRHVRVRQRPDRYAAIRRMQAEIAAGLRCVMRRPGRPARWRRPVLTSRSAFGVHSVARIAMFAFEERAGWKRRSM